MSVNHSARPTGISIFFNVKVCCVFSLESKVKKIRGRENISIGTWNVRTVRPAGKLKELTHEIDKYHWNILGFL